MKILYITLHRRWFDDIASEIKKEEYREIKPYWTSKLEKEYDVIEFRNGYNKNSPAMRVEYLGVRIKPILHPITHKVERVYALKLGRILMIRNYETAKTTMENIRRRNGQAR